MLTSNTLSYDNYEILKKLNFWKHLIMFPKINSLNGVKFKWEIFFYLNKKKNLFLFSFINKWLYLFINLNEIKNFYFSNLLLSLNLCLKLEELELKGINYWFSKFLSTILLDLGCSHFQIFNYPFNYFFTALKKKKSKKILFINFNNNYFLSTVKFFWFKLKSVGPYKLKGFQFTNERITLKEGKKPFK